MRHIILLLSLVVTANMAGAASKPAGVSDLLQSAENLTFLTMPERVEVCILTRKEPLFRKKSGKHRYVEGPAKPLPAAAVERLRTRLASDDTYRWHTDATGEPVWSVRVKFFRGDEFLSADFCFESGLILFARDGLPFSAEDFIDPEDEFFALVRAPFPRDKSLRALESILTGRQRERDARNAAFEKAGESPTSP